MNDRIILTIFFMIFVAWGILGIVRPDITYRTIGSNTWKKQPRKLDIKFARIRGYIFVCVGLSLILITWIGGFRGV